jgi:cation:H+ antiporter
MTGMLVLAGATSLPDFAATLSAATDGRASLAMGNIMGSMAVNLAFLGIGDLVYRKANLEHAAASAPNMMQGALLIALLAIPLLSSVAPRVEAFGVHPATPLLLLAYLFGIRLVRHAHHAPMWRPRSTPQTVEDRPEQARGGLGLTSLWLRFGALSAVTAISGWYLMEAAEALVDHTALSEAQAGGVLTAMATSTPELVTTIAAIRRGALTLAVANIVGTNCFNTTVIAAADLAYREGSIYHAIPAAELTWGLLSILMTAILLLGMLRRETYGIGNIGFESFGILSLYGAGVALVFAAT